MGMTADVVSALHAANEAELLAKEAAGRVAVANAAAATLRGFGDDKPPARGVTIEQATSSDLALMKKFWTDREASGTVTAAWSIDNPYRTYIFNMRRCELQQKLGRDPDQLEGLHGSSPENYISIVSEGFRSDLRSGQVYGAGEYFAKCPNISVGYCKGRLYMLVCRLLLGVKSSTAQNKDGDHIWVPQAQYYVISSPEQVLPVFIVRFETSPASVH